MRTLFKGGTVISGSGAKRADVLTDGEKILAVGRNLKQAADAVTDGCGNIVTALPAGMMDDGVLEGIGKTLGCKVETSDGTVSTYGVGSPEMPLTAGADFLSGRALIGTLAAFALQDMVAGALLAVSSGPWTDRGEMVLETRAERIGLDTVEGRTHLPAGKGRGGELVLRASGFDSDGAYGGFPWKQ